jgi:hypothetical protein
VHIRLFMLKNAKNTLKIRLTGFSLRWALASFFLDLHQNLFLVSGLVHKQPISQTCLRKW